MNKKAWIIFATVCVLLVGGLIFYSNSKKLNVEDVTAGTVLGAENRNGNVADHVFGKPDSKVILIEYGDFQCPGCGSVYPRVKTVTEKYKDQLTFIFRNFPLTSIHPNAKVAAASAEAAGLQGKYWEMHDKLYENQDSWKDLTINQRVDYFVNYASELGLNTDQFRQDLDNQSISQKIAFDQALGKKQAVDATPTLLLNGTKLDSAVYGSDSAFEDAIVAELKKAGISLPQ